MAFRSAARLLRSRLDVIGSRDPLAIVPEWKRLLPLRSVYAVDRDAGGS